MRRFALAATLIIAALTLAGCKSQQQDQKENADQLEAKWKALDDQYKKECYDPYSSVVASKDTLHKAFSGEPGTKADAAAFQKAEADKAARIASPHCQTLAAERKDVGNRAVAATH